MHLVFYSVTMCFLFKKDSYADIFHKSKNLKTNAEIDLSHTKHHQFITLKKTTNIGLRNTMVLIGIQIQYGANLRYGRYC